MINIICILLIIFLGLYIIKMLIPLGHFVYDRYRMYIEKRKHLRFLKREKLLFKNGWTKEIITVIKGSPFVYMKDGLPIFGEEYIKKISSKEFNNILNKKKMRYRTEVFGKINHLDNLQFFIIESNFNPKEITSISFKTKEISFDGTILSVTDTEQGGEGCPPNSHDLTAEQARDISVRPSLKKVLKKIKKAALEGDSSILMYLTPREVNHLKNLGYKVTLTGFDPRLYEISWEN